MSYNSPTLLRKVVVLQNELVELYSIDIQQHITRQLEIELSEKIFQELRHKKSLTITLMKDKEVNQIDQFSSELITDIKLIPTKNIKDDIFKILNSIEDSELIPDSIGHHRAISNTVQFFRQELNNLFKELEK